MGEGVSKLSCEYTCRFPGTPGVLSISDIKQTAQEYSSGKKTLHNPKQSYPSHL